MKKHLIFSLLLYLLPLRAYTQIVDTAAVIREVDSLIQVSRALTEQRDFDQAMEINAAAEKIALEKLGRETAAYGSTCFNHGRICYLKRDLSASEKWYLEAKAIREKVLGKEHPDYARNLSNLALLYHQMGHYEQAEPLYLEAKAIREKVLGKEHPDYAMSLHFLGNLYFDMGNFMAAESFYLKAKIIREQVLGKEHPDYAWSLNNLANVYLEVGNYEKAESLYLEAKAIREKVLGKEHTDYATSLHNLANLYFRMGGYQKSELYYLEALSILEKTIGKEDPDYLRTLNSLAVLYWRMSHYEKAEPLLLEAATIREKVLGNGHQDYAWSLNCLANLYFDMGKYEKAEPLFLKCKAIQEKAIGKEHPDYAWNLNNLANLYWRTGHYEKAESLLLESKTIREKGLGKEHPDYAASLIDLANLYYKMSNYERAEPLFNQLAYLNQSLITKALRHLSEQELNDYLGKSLSDQNQLLSFAQIAASRSQMSQACYDNTLFYKGFLLHAANQIKHLALSPTSDGVATEKFNLLRSYRRRLAAEYAKPIIERKNVPELEEKANTLEKDLARTVAGYGEAMRQVKWPEVQSALKPGEAALEFIHYRYYTPKATDSMMYAALLLRPGDTQPQFIPLFEEKELLPLLRGTTGGSNFLKINALYAQKTADNKQKTLYELIWKPLETLLKDSKTVYCAPSGLLHRLNLAAIPNASGKTFGDQHGLVLLGSTRQLVIPSVVIPSGNASNTAYLAGGIRYDADSTALTLANRGASSRSIEGPNPLPFQPDSASATRGGTLDYLPATAAEVREIGQTLTAAGIRAKVDTGFYATEEAFRQLGVGAPSPRIVHLATHGYFFPDPVKKDQKTFGGFGQEPVFKMSEHPMIRSGLVLAGAKQAWLTGKHSTGLEDGILTAYEISQMNLTGTELVVLSACETGLGDIVGNEGVYGLQRAFKIAGAKYLIMSLWKVDDQSTRKFMTAFYRHWLTDKQPVPQAFHAAQRELRAKGVGAYDWAGFVLVE